jgi:V8-like Glu-specific endopeptidase
MKTTKQNGTFFAIQFSKIQRLATVTLISVSTLGGLITTTLTPAQAVIVGKDDRVTPSYEWMTRPGQQRAAFGQLEILFQNGQYGYCSFTMVGRNVGLTNSHCVLDDQGRPAFQIKAFAARHGNNPGTKTPRYRAKTNVTEFVSGLVNKDPRTANDFANDWAIIRLKDPIGDITGWLDLVPVGQSDKNLKGKTTNYIGYPGDWPAGTPALHSGAQFINMQSSGIVLHNADITPGTSGSGMYRFIADNNLQIQAVNNSEGWRTTDGQTVNGAVSVEKVRDTLSHYRKAWTP